MVYHTYTCRQYNDMYFDFCFPVPHSWKRSFILHPVVYKSVKPKFRSLLFLVNINKMKIDTLGHILVPVLLGPGGCTVTPFGAHGL